MKRFFGLSVIYLFLVIVLGAFVSNAEPVGTVETVFDQSTVPIFIIPANDEDQLTIDSALISISKLEAEVEESRTFRTALERSKYYRQISELRKQQSSLCTLLSGLTEDPETKRFYRIKAHNIRKFATKYMAKYYNSLPDNAPRVSYRR